MMKTSLARLLWLLTVAGEICLLLALSAVPGYSAVGESPYNPPEFYDRIRTLRKKIIEEQRQKIDLKTHPRYRTIVTDSATELRVEQVTHWFEVNKYNGVVDKVGLLDVVCNNHCAFGDLEITDKDGIVYRQSNSNDGSVKVNDENIYLFWTARFSPVSQEGKVLPVKIEAIYQLFKLSGFVTVRYKVTEGSAKIKQIVIRNSPGTLPVNLTIAHSAFFLDNAGKFHDTLTVDVPNLDTRLIASGKIVAPFWTDGRIGFHATALRWTWYQMGPFDEGKQEKRTVIETIDGRRYLDFYFVNTDTPTLIEDGREMECGFAFLPFHQYQPKLLLTHGIDLGLQYKYLESGDEKDLRAIIRDFRETYWTGAVFCGTSLAGAGWTPLMYAVTKEPYYKRTKTIRDLGRACGLILGTAHCVVNNWPGIPGLKPHSGAEENAYKPELLEAMLKESERVYPPEVFAEKMKQAEETGYKPYLCTLSTPETRDFWLDVRTSTLEALGVDADYEDLHAHIDVGPNFDSQVEGELRYLEDIALLHEAYGGDKKIIAHAGNILTIADSMNAATWPGEPWTGQNFDELPVAVLDILLNPFLIGTDVGFYGHNDIYTLESLKMCKQLLRNSVVPMYATVVKGLGGSIVRPLEVKSASAKEAWEKYFVPGRTFRIDRAKYISWRDPEASKFFTPANPEYKVNLYYRNNEAYVTCVEMSDRPVKPALKFNVTTMGFQGPEAFVFDIIMRKLSVLPVHDGWIEYSPAQPTNEPLLLYIKDKLNDAPAVIWADFPVQFEKTTTGTQSDTEEVVSGVSWKYSIPVYPLESRDELVRVYTGKMRRPRSYAPWGIAFIHKWYPEEKSADLVLKITRAEEGGPIGGPGAGGADGVSGEIKLGFDKSFQLSFPYLGE